MGLFCLLSSCCVFSCLWKELKCGIACDQHNDQTSVSASPLEQWEMCWICAVMHVSDLCIKRNCNFLAPDEQPMNTIKKVEVKTLIFWLTMFDFLSFEVVSKALTKFGQHSVVGVMFDLNII